MRPRDGAGRSNSSHFGDGVSFTAPITGAPGVGFIPPPTSPTGNSPAASPPRKQALHYQSDPLVAEPQPPLLTTLRRRQAFSEENRLITKATTCS
ncbi:hypothetical protein scyTo_0000810 [Scyliorhinus torazame]|uniref:Uncharacterized protein n=1 Tax=Scyliorhinus torazame TaxID=75743 RepID=A0A401P4M3_SCYTO|nr:hypothetical protein [Scyliorhinus torazame]